MKHKSAVKKVFHKKTGPYQVNGTLAIDIREAAKFTGFSVSAIRNRIEAGEIPYRKCVARIIFDREELRQWFSKLPGVSVEDALNKIAS